QDNTAPATRNTGSVRPISQLNDASSKIRNAKASERPTARAVLARRRSSRAVKTEMKTRLSIPRTISSAVNVKSAAQALASESRFRKSDPADPFSDIPGRQEIDGDSTQSESHRVTRGHVRPNGHQRACPPKRDQCDVHRPPQHNTDRMNKPHRNECQRGQS